MKRTIPTLLVLVAASAGWVASAATQARLQSQTKMPAAVRAAVERAYPQATLGQAERVRVALSVYEVDVQNGAEAFEVQVASDGTIVAVEQGVTMNRVPGAVAQTLAQLAGDAEIREIERGERRAKPGFVALSTSEVRYEAEWTHDGHEIEVCIAEDGALLGGGDDDDDDDDDGPDDD